LDFGGEAIRDHLHLKASLVEVRGLFFVQLLKAFLAAGVSHHLLQALSSPPQLPPPPSW
jgi:hypothetical protein